MWRTGASPPKWRPRRSRGRQPDAEAAPTADESRPELSLLWPLFVEVDFLASVPSLVPAELSEEPSLELGEPEDLDVDVPSDRLSFR